MSKVLSKLAEILMNEDLSYNEEGAQRFKKAGLTALRALGKKMDFTEVKTSYNRSGIAGSGDLLMMGMWSENHGVYVSIYKDFGETTILYRSIKHMRDFTGGKNCYLPVHKLSNEEYVIETLKSVL